MWYWNDTSYSLHETRRTTKIKIKNQKSKIKKSKIKNQKSKIKNQKSKIKNQKSKIKNQKSKLKNQNILSKHIKYFTQIFNMSSHTPNLLNTYQGSFLINFKCFFVSLTTVILNNINYHYIDPASYNTNNISHIINIFLILHYILDYHYRTTINKFHHITSILLLTIPLFSSYQYRECDYIVLNFEVSSIFLNLYFLTQYKTVRLLFATTFLYYRIYKYYEFLLWNFNSNEVYLVCETNSLYNINFCYILSHFTIYTLFIMNTYWSSIIIRKICKLIKN